MQNISSAPRGLSLASGAMAAIIALLLAALPFDQAAGASPKKPAEEVEGQHVSNLHIKDTDLPLTKRVWLGRNKAMSIEMPRELRDVMVSAPEIMDAVVQSSNRVHLVGKKVGQSNAFFFDANGEQILTLEVVIDEDTGPLDALINRLIPGAMVKSEILNETVILTGSVRNPIDASRASDIASRFIVPAPDKAAREPVKVINMLAVEGEEQVNLRVVVAEVQRSLLKQFGINLGASINAGNFSTSLLTENALPLTSVAGLGSLAVPGIGTAGAVAGAAATCATAGVLCNYNQGPGASTFGNSGLDGGWASGGNTISHTLRALERDGLVKTLAEPNLTAISGESAKFLAGGEFPVPTSSTNGEIKVEFKEFGIGVAFTPTVLSEGRISLKIETEVSELTSEGAVRTTTLTIPAIKKRQAKSTLELPSGGTMAMAGLISDDVRQNIDGLPGMKDLPILGTLFRSRDFVKKETELVVMVTPYLVKPVARQELARPLDGLGEASDMKANFMGHLNRIYGGGSAAPAGDLKGDYGFIVE